MSRRSAAEEKLFIKKNIFQLFLFHLFGTTCCL